MKDGIARVPEEPGLGIEVDETALAKYAKGGWKTIALS
jgi:L-alanine-DL-glutamate epimerase-like enolase superfamily enzyme